ncbi:MAG: T9SS type A sorting domain-containing protein [Bergeyella sp.]
MKSKSILAAALLFTICEMNAQVSLPSYEGFDYTTGSKVITTGSSSGLGSWMLPFSTTGSSADPYVIASPSWSLPANLPAATGNAIEFVGGGDDPLIPIPDQGTTGTLYSSFVFRITEQSAVTLNNTGYFYSFAKTASSGTSLNYTSCVYYKKISDTTFNLGISENNNTTNAVWATDTFTTGQDIFVVIAYDIDNAVSKMWINPVINGTEPTAPYATDETTTSTRNNLDKVRLSLEANAQTPTINLDEIRIGNTWASVTTGYGSLGVLQSNFSDDISISPNPAKDFISVNSGNLKISSVQIFTTSGEIVTSRNGLSGGKIDVSALPKGVYIMKINADGKSVSKKFIKD